MDITAPHCLPPILGRSSSLLGYLVCLLQWLNSHQKPKFFHQKVSLNLPRDPTISWPDGFRKKGELQNTARGILTRERLSPEKIFALQGCKISCFTVMKVLLSNVLQQSALNGVTIAEVKHFIWNQVYISPLFGDLA